MKIALDKEINKEAGFFRFQELNGKVLLTNDVGNFMVLKNNQFTKFIEGRLSREKVLYRELFANNFISNPTSHLNLIEKYRFRNSFLWEGPSLHIMVLTLRCNHSCIYCQASAKSLGALNYDMTKNTAKNAVDIIFDSPSRNVKIEFQGGEPLLNWKCLEFIINYAQKKNKIKKKNLSFSLVTNLSLMSFKRLSYLLKNNVKICTSLDGPRALHNKNRLFPGCRNNSYKFVEKWLKIKNSKLKNCDFAALVTVSKYSLMFPKEIINEYVKWGFGSIHLRPLSNLGRSGVFKERVGYSADVFFKFYKIALDYLIELNLKGKSLMSERTACIFLSKILADANNLNYLDTRSPCGAGIGQLLYNYDGKVYTCDEARMISEETFLIGNVNDDGYDKICRSVNVKSCCFASCLDGLYCDYCVYKPYCGVCPVCNYAESGNIFGQITVSERCILNKSILDYLFLKLQDKKINRIFNYWKIGGQGE